MMSYAVSREGERTVAVVCCVALAVVILAVGAKLAMEWGLAWRCPLLAVLAVPCPSCGSTRAFAALAGLDLRGALGFNPLMVLGIFFLPFLVAVKRWPVWIQRSGWTIFGTVVALNWVYLYLFLPR